MDLTNNYDIKNFNKYKNIYAIEIEVIPIIEKIDDHNDIEKINKLKTKVNVYKIFRHLEFVDSHIIFVGIKLLFHIIYGHMYNNANMMICKRLHFDNLGDFKIVKYDNICKNEYNKPMFFKNLDLAKYNLKHIKKHYKQKNLVDNYINEYITSTKYIDVTDYLS